MAAGSPVSPRRRRASDQLRLLASFRPVLFVVDINDLLDEEGELPADPRVRHNALRFVSFIEYGGTLKPLQGRETSSRAAAGRAASSASA